MSLHIAFWVQDSSCPSSTRIWDKKTSPHLRGFWKFHILWLIILTRSWCKTRPSYTFSSGMILVQPYHTGLLREALSLQARLHVTRWNWHTFTCIALEFLAAQARRIPLREVSAVTQRPINTTVPSCSVSFFILMNIMLPGDWRYLQEWERTADSG